MQKQMDKIDEIMEKSNNTLLYAETQNNMDSLLSPPKDANQTQSQTIYNLKPNCELAIVKTLEQFQLLMKHNVDSDTNSGAMSPLDACLSYRQRTEFQASSMRKLGALNDNMLQLQHNLEQQWQLAQDEDEDKENTIEDEF